MKYMIHACEDRNWYVESYMIPSMTEQGILREDILVWLDKEHKGNLISCLESFADCGKADGLTWHLQDDVLICRDFFEKSKIASASQITCGFCPKSFTSHHMDVGEVKSYKIWWSFQCICIPNELAGEFYKWFYEDCSLRNRESIQNRIKGGKDDDWFFKKFIRECHPYIVVNNLRPNLVEHVDYLIGGSKVNIGRTRDMTATWFRDKDLVENLRKRLEDEKLSGANEA